MAKTATSKASSSGTPSTSGKVKEVKKATGKTKHPLQGSSDKNVYPFKVLPADYDIAKNSALKTKDFASKAPFYEYKAKVLEFQAQQFRAKATAEAALPADKETKASAKRLQRLANTMLELQKTLGSKGVDVAAIIAAAKKSAGVADSDGQADTAEQAADNTQTAAA
jgi:hypothetical protein